ncbi:hypothetical protein JCM17960_24320 [Magnetospira thiophila]
MDMSILLWAFAWGILSAASLPLGTLTTWFWSPQDRAVAVLMAFGGGALLAALTIDLVGSSLDHGHVWPLTIGCLLGGILFFLLNQTINNHGGFLRKSSTMIRYLGRQRRKKVEKLLTHLESLDIFRDLPTSVIEELACAARPREMTPGISLFYQGEPADSFYVIETGEVDLIDNRHGHRFVRRQGPASALGHPSLLTGMPRALSAIAATDGRVWRIPKRALDRCLLGSRDMSEVLARFIRGDVISGYLIREHDLEASQVAHWQEQATAAVLEAKVLTSVSQAEVQDSGFSQVAGHIGRFPIFARLEGAELKAVAERLILSHHRPGDTLFLKGEPADRFLIVEYGEVTLVDPTNTTQPQTQVHDLEAFGGLSFLTGARHSVTAVVTAETAVWSLEREDFEQLLGEVPQLDRQVREVLESRMTSDYLENRLRIEHQKAAKWIRHATRNLAEGRLIPSARDLAREVGQHKGAPLAIWLGILLDGIPESLVIGAGQTHSHVSLSLIIGLFLSNYPEALSSSVGMRQQGWSFRRVLFMWTTLMILTGIGAALGSLFFVGAAPWSHALVRGLAAGAMLTMIAETMLPEAYLKGGSLVGLSTLAGFLTAIVSTSLG